MNECVVRVNEQTDERVPSTPICILGYSGPQCTGGRERDRRKRGGRRIGERRKKKSGWEEE